MPDTLHIGKIINSKQEKDAVHMAIAPVVAGEELHPGEHVGIDEKGLAYTMPKNNIGIVDPFIPHNFSINEGEKFWLFLYPGSITSLRHEWTHGAFKKESDTKKELSVKWLTNFGNTVGYGYASLLHALDSARVNGYYCVSDDSTQEEFDNNKVKLFNHYASVTGNVVDIDEVYFSCAC